MEQIRTIEQSTDRHRFRQGAGEPLSLAAFTALAARGRGTVAGPAGRYEPYARQAVDDGWQSLLEQEAVQTEVTWEAARTVITRNTSPDIPFDRSINAYRGCEHGCAYCYARPAHAYMGLSPGRDFESRLFAKSGAAEALRRQLARPGYKVRPIAMGTNTDPYQPIEKQHAITRLLLEVLYEVRHPVTIVTKSALILRDRDLLAALAAEGLIKVALSVTTLDRHLARRLEPRASTPQRRLDAIRLLSEAGVPVSVLAAPMIPALNDSEMEAILAAVAHAGAREAGYILLRLPGEVAGLFEDWLRRHVPDRAERVLNRLRAMRGGRMNDPRFGHRMRGGGIEADLLSARFRRAANKLGLNQGQTALRCDLFRPPSGMAAPVAPAPDSRQLTLFEAFEDV